MNDFFNVIGVPTETVEGFHVIGGGIARVRMQGPETEFLTVEDLHTVRPHAPRTHHCSDLEGIRPPRSLS